MAIPIYTVLPHCVSNPYIHSITYTVLCDTYALAWKKTGLHANFTFIDVLTWICMGCRLCQNTKLKTEHNEKHFKSA